MAIRAVAVGVGVLVAVAGCASRPIGSPNDPPARSGTEQPAAPLQAPPGRRPVTFHGLAIDVPTTWGLNATRCGGPLRDTVILPGAVAACGVTRVPKVTSVEFVERQVPDLRSTLTDARSSTFVLDGQPATRLVGRRDGLVVIAVTVPSVSAQVVITSPKSALAQSLAATLTITAADANGCPTHAPNTSALPTRERASRSGAADSLIPGTPRQVTVCRYLATLIEQSTRLDARHRATFVATLNALPAGLSRADPKTYVPEICRQPATSAGSVDDLTAMDSEAYLVTATYETGPDVVVLVRLGQCGDLGASNGTRTGQRTDALAEQLVSAAGESVGYPGAVGPA
jgi:hypothetical protein